MVASKESTEGIPFVQAFTAFVGPGQVRFCWRDRLWLDSLGICKVLGSKRRGALLKKVKPEDQAEFRVIGSTCSSVFVSYFAAADMLRRVRSPHRARLEVWLVTVPPMLMQVFEGMGQHVDELVKVSFAKHMEGYETTFRQSLVLNNGVRSELGFSTLN